MSRYHLILHYVHVLCIFIIRPPVFLLLVCNLHYVHLVVTPILICYVDGPSTSINVDNSSLCILFSDTFQEVKSKRDKKKEVRTDFLKLYNVPYRLEYTIHLIITICQIYLVHKLVINLLLAPFSFIGWIILIMNLYALLILFSTMCDSLHQKLAYSTTVLVIVWKVLYS